MLLGFVPCVGGSVFWSVIFNLLALMEEASRACNKLLSLVRPNSLSAFSRWKHWTIEYFEAQLRIGCFMVMKLRKEC